jgi:hypothetical protein
MPVWYYGGCDYLQNFYSVLGAAFDVKSEKGKAIAN